MDSQISKDKFKSSGDFFDSYIEKGVGVIHIKDKVFEIAHNLPLKGKLFDKIRLAEKLSEINVLLIMSDESILGEGKNLKFWRETIEASNGELQLVREENSLIQFIEMMCHFKKIVISAVQGSVIGAFLGAILSSDFRVASENTIFSFPYMQYGLPPQGALAFILPRYIGIAKAKSILLRAEPIDSSQALNFSLIDKVFPTNGFENSCLEFAREFVSLSPSVVGMTKRLFACSMTELQTYFKMEAKFIGLNKVKLPPDNARSES